MSGVEAIEVVVAAHQVDLASGLLWGIGVTAVAEHAVDDGRVLLRTDVPPGGVDAARSALAALGVEPVVVAVDDGLDGWRDHAVVATAGRRIVVRPPWVPLGEVAEGAVVVEIDPGRSWGHGAHPTTRLCLAAVEAALDQRPGASVLDVGCGSGTLAVAAAMLGAARVVACDIDPAAVDATRSNASRNGIAGIVDVHLVPDRRRFDVDSTKPMSASSGGGGALGEVEGRFDVVVANIGAAALVDLATDLLAHLESTGSLVLSGLLDPVPDHVVEAYAPLRVDRVDTLDGWSALTLAAPDRARPNL